MWLTVIIVQVTNYLFILLIQLMITFPTVHQRATIGGGFVWLVDNAIF